MNDDVVAQFTEITGSSPELASQYLQLADFNIEQGVLLYFENGGAPLTDEPSTSGPQRVSGRQDESGVVHIDSDDDVTVDEMRSVPRGRPAPAAAFEDDEAMARRLQEEIYGGGGGGGAGEDDVRAPMARTTETLVGPEDDFDDGMQASILARMRSRGQRSSKYSAPSSFLLWVTDCVCSRSTWHLQPTGYLVHLGRRFRSGQS
jgi:hypothetical protein